MEEIKFEKLIENSPNPVEIKGTENILFQMKNCICKIYNKNKKGTGFFLKTPFPGKNTPLYLLVTNNHILEESDLENGKIIETTINDDDFSKNIEINNSRKRYTCSILDITFVEIIPNIDKIEDFLELDETINSNIEILEKKYRNKSIYILHYPKGTESHVSYGLLNYMKNGNFNHYCSTEDGSSGSPILSLDNNKIIGIHKGCLKKENPESNVGIFIKIALDKFYSKYQNKEEEKISENKNDCFKGEIKSYNNLKKKNLKKHSNYSIYLKYIRNIKTSSNINESSSNNKNMSDRSKYTINDINIEKILSNSKNTKKIKNNKIVKNSTISSSKELLGIMNNLFSENESEKKDTIIIINEILCTNYQQNKFILIPNIDNIIRIIIRITHELLLDSLDKIKNKINSLKLIKSLVVILCELIENKEFIIHINYNVLYDLCYELLNYLLIDGLKQIGSNDEGNIIFKSVNNSMLGVIENCDKTSVILVFLKIIKQNYNNINLSILSKEYFLKATENIQSIINSLKLHKILLQMHLIIYNLDLSKNKIEENSLIKFIKNFILDIVKIKKEEIIEDYNKSIAYSQYKDNYIYNWIKNELLACSISEKKFEELNKDRANNINNNDIKKEKKNSMDKRLNSQLYKSPNCKSEKKKYNIKKRRMYNKSFNLDFTKSSIFDGIRKNNKNTIDN